MNKSKESIGSEIVAFLAQEANIDAAIIEKDMIIFESGLFDSIVIVSLLAFCEENYGIEIDLTTIDQSAFESVSSISEYIIKEMRI